MLIALLVVPLLTGLAGCGDARPSPPPASYGREGAAIGLARERTAEVERRQATERPAQAPAAAVPSASAPAAPVPTAGTVKHVVIAWLKTPGNKAARQKVIDSAAALRTIPGVLDVAAGECLPSDRGVVDSSYDVAIVTTFADERALEEFGPHPVHQKALADVIKPNVERYVVYDVVVK